MRRCKFKKQNEAAEEKSYAVGYEEFIKNCKARNLSNYTLRYYQTIDYVMKQYCDENEIFISNIDITFYDDFILMVSSSVILAILFPA